MGGVVHQVDEGRRQRENDALLRLAESERRFERMADESSILIWLSDAENSVTYINRAKRELIGAPASELRGDAWKRFVHPDDMRAGIRDAWTAIRARRAFEVQYRLLAADGSWRWVLDVGNPRFDAAGQYLGYIGAGIDVTDRIHAEEALAQARRELAHGEKLAAMGSLVSGVAHEIRTPLAYMANHAALLQARLARAQREGGDLAAIAPDVAEATRAIEEGVERIGALISDLRRFVRAEAAPRALARLDEVARGALRMFEATHREVVLDAELGETPATPLERGQIQQVVLNLLENATDASQPGAPIRLRTRATDDGAELVIEDEGCGIPSEVQARMWEPFFTTRPDGTGLGLAIVRRIVESHGGSIRVHSVVGKGSRFTLELPA